MKRSSASRATMRSLSALREAEAEYKAGDYESDAA